jgi:hypothetical protein
MGGRLPRRFNVAHLGVSTTSLAIMAFAGLVACMVVPGVAGAAAAQGDAARQDASSMRGLSGVWWAKTFSAKMQPMDGAIAFTDAGKRAYEKNIAGLKNGSVKDESRTICVPDGMPRVMASPYPFQIIQTPGQVTFAHEVNHSWRTARLGGTHPRPADAIIYWNGDEVAHWEGDTLVVDTVNLNDRTFVDATGLPHSTNLHVTERLRLLDGGNELEDVITLEDPMVFTKPWRTRFVYERRNDIHIDEFVCGEQHRDLSGVKGAPVESAARAP